MTVVVDVDDQVPRPAFRQPGGSTERESSGRTRGLDQCADDLLDFELVAVAQKGEGDVRIAGRDYTQTLGAAGDVASPRFGFGADLDRWVESEKDPKFPALSAPAAHLPEVSERVRPSIRN